MSKQTGTVYLCNIFDANFHEIDFLPSLSLVGRTYNRLLLLTLSSYKVNFYNESTWFEGETTMENLVPPKDYSPKCSENNFAPA